MVASYEAGLSFKGEILTAERFAELAAALPAVPVSAGSTVDYDGSALPRGRYRLETDIRVILLEQEQQRTSGTFVDYEFAGSS